MDINLFAKYSKTIERQASHKKEIIDFIKKETGVIFKEEEIVLEKNKISFHTSSVKKITLLNKKIQEFFFKKKYKLKQ